MRKQTHNIQLQNGERMTYQKIYDENLEIAVTKLKTLEYFVKEAKRALGNEDWNVCELAETTMDRAESFYHAILELRKAEEELQEENGSK